ncbi:MAG: AAA family ATPase [Candidatus Poribacteria bacterium]|nr:AAA family ATPase [Candidatus Poribacteria bacterium]
MQKTKNEQQYPNIQIAVENFGPVEKAEIDLRPLTVFVGESNTGKTYLSALIYALQLTFDGISQVPWSPHRIIQLDRISRSRYSRPSTQVLRKEIEEMLEKLNVTGQPFKFSDSPQWLQDRLQSDLVDSERFKDELRRCFDLESASDLIKFTEGQHNAMKVSLEVREENQILWSFGVYNSDSEVTTDGFVNEDTILRHDDRAALWEILDTGDWRQEPVRIFSWSAPTKSYYLPAARSGIMETHGVIASSLVDRATRVGLERFSEIPAFSGLIADFLKQIIGSEERHLPSDEMNGIAKVLEDEVLRGEIEVKQPAAAYPEFRYRPHKSEQALRMSRSSSMVSELAPLVFFLRDVVRPGDTLIIEEPEAHLHPAAQTKVALTLARLVRVGVRVIITTHSDWLLEQIGNLVREGEVMKLGKNKTEPATWLTKEEVGAWWFHTDKPVEEIPFDNIEGIEPKDYYDIAEELHNNAVEFQQHLLNEEEFGDDE